jgi:hypothetical protein
MGPTAVDSVVPVRLWSVHPQYFDRQALTACWREALLAQAVLAGATRGYRQHPQLERFRTCASPGAAIGAFLSGVVDEAETRRYNFNRAKILVTTETVELIPVTAGQLAYEWSHLMTKLARRSPQLAARWTGLAVPQPHPLFTVIEGAIASWERPTA